MKLIIFDLDGTLVDSLNDLAASANHALDKCGFPIHDAEKYRYFVGDGVPKLIERALPEGERSDDIILKVKSEFDAYYKEHYADFTLPYEGIPELVSKLKNDGYVLAIASNKPDEFTGIIVERLFGNLFDYVVGKRPDTEKKPAPDIILKIMEKASCNADEAVMIGDSNVDILTAKNAGIRSVGCLWGFRTAEELKAAGADYLVPEPMEILNCI